MNLNQLIYFASLAQLQHVTRASEKLNIAQPSLSKAIANLEQELGVDLFEKQGRNVVLTRQGKLYLDYVEKALESLEEGRSALQRMQTELDQRIDIGFVSSLQARMMPQLLADKTNAVYTAEPAADAIAVTCTAILFSIEFRKALKKLNSDSAGGTQTAKTDLRV